MNLIEKKNQGVMIEHLCTQGTNEHTQKLNHINKKK